MLWPKHSCTGVKHHLQASIENDNFVDYKQNMTLLGRVLILWLFFFRLFFAEEILLLVYFEKIMDLFHNFQFFLPKTIATIFGFNCIRLIPIERSSLTQPSVVLVTDSTGFGRSKQMPNYSIPMSILAPSSCLSALQFTVRYHMV